MGLSGNSQNAEEGEVQSKPGQERRCLLQLNNAVTELPCKLMFYSIIKIVITKIGERQNGIRKEKRVG